MMKTRFGAVVLSGLLVLGCGKSDSGDGDSTSSSTSKPAADPKDWAEWGYSSAKNMAAEGKNIPADFEPGEIGADGNVEMGTTENMLWVAKLGSETYGNPTVAGGRVYVGTNNAGRDDARFKGDMSLLKCLDAATGDAIWTLTVPKLGSGKVGDWEYLGICSSPTVVGDRVYIVTNRCEVMALDVNGLADGNQGFQGEGQYMSMRGTTPLKPVEVKKDDADIIWTYDMREELGVYPHNITSSSILVVGDYLWCSTSNGVTYDHTDIPFPKAPALIGLNRKLAEDPNAKPDDILYGEEGSGLSKRILHGNWTSPCWGEADGKGMILYGGPEGVMYAFDPVPVKDEDGFGVLTELWQYDCNPVHYRFKDGDESQPIKYVKPEGPSEIIATPVFYKGRVYVAIGQDPEHGEGKGMFSCIDVATGKKVWDYPIHRSISTCSIVGDEVYVADHSGFVYCFNVDDGKMIWKYDTLGLIWSSTLAVDGKLFSGNDDGDMSVIHLEAMRNLASELGAPIEAVVKRNKLVVTGADKSKKKEVEGEEIAKIINRVDFDGAQLRASPVVAQGVVYIATMSHLYAIKAGGK